jgi:YHS domain-containing protein
MHASYMFYRTRVKWVITQHCSINGQVEGRTYCFGSAEAKAEFMKNPTANLAKAQATYQSLKKPG